MSAVIVETTAGEVREGDELWCSEELPPRFRVVSPFVKHGRAWLYVDGGFGANWEVEASRPVLVRRPAPSPEGEPVDQMRALLDADRALRQERDVELGFAGAFRGAVTHSGAKWLTELNRMGFVIARAPAAQEEGESR